jgi:RNase P protein component
MKEVGQSLNLEDEEQLERVFECGEGLESGKQVAEVLYGESDGVWICLQGEERKKTEVRVGILYTGKKVIATGRNRLENKVVVTKIVKNSQEWQETLLKTA